MKFLILLTALFVQTAFAQEPKVECDMNRRDSHQFITIGADDVLHVIGHEYMSGHRWVSTINLQSTVLEPAPMGGMDTVEFLIDAKLQNQKTRYYQFIYKRPWESTNAAKCSITVTKK